LAIPNEEGSTKIVVLKHNTHYSYVIILAKNEDRYIPSYNVFFDTTYSSLGNHSKRKVSHKILAEEFYRFTINTLRRHGYTVRTIYLDPEFYNKL